MTRGRGPWAPTTGAGPLFGTAPPCSSTGGGALTNGALNGHPSGGAFTVCGFCGSSAAAGVAFGRAHSMGLGTLPQPQHPILVPKRRGFGPHAQCGSYSQFLSSLAQEGQLDRSLTTLDLSQRADESYLRAQRPATRTVRAPAARLKQPHRRPPWTDEQLGHPAPRDARACRPLQRR